jgi:hypothetical protein
VVFLAESENGGRGHAFSLLNLRWWRPAVICIGMCFALGVLRKVVVGVWEWPAEKGGCGCLG